MSDTESLDYLQPGFDPKSLTMPRLRSILVAYNIQYPSTAKKAQLIDIFNEQLLPLSKKILDRRARAKRSSRGISNAEVESSTSQESNPFHNTQNDFLPPPPASTRSRRSQSSRKASAGIKSEDYDNQGLTPAVSPSKRRSRPSSRQPNQDTDTDTGPDMAGSRSRSTRAGGRAIPQPTNNGSDGLFSRKSDAFTYDNPFQSGTSTPAPEKAASSRRKTATNESMRAVSSSRPSRPVARDDSPDGDDVPVPRASRSVGRPVGSRAPSEHRVSPALSPDIEPEGEYGHYEEFAPQSMVEAGEEFTPEEQLELHADEVAKERTAVIRATGRQVRHTGSWGTPFLVLLVALLGAYAAWFRQEKMAVGYCGVGRSVGSMPTEIPVPEWAQSVLPPRLAIPRRLTDMLGPRCEPCPPHAYCHGDFSVGCEHDYILKLNPLSLRGLFPIPPTCEPDGEKARRVQAVANKAVEELRQRTAQYECGAAVNAEGDKVESPAIKEKELKEIINQKRSKKMSNQEFEDLWRSALGDIKARDEVEAEVKEFQSGHTGAVPDNHLTSTSLARVPFTCAVRRSVRLGLARYRIPIVALTSLVLAALYARSRYLSHRAAVAQVPALVDVVLGRLAKQKQLDDDVDDPWLFLPNLRDDVLRNLHSLKQRERIWQRVRAVVEQNSNVRTSQREGRSGEMGRAWEWIGPLAVEAGHRRKSGRLSHRDESKDSDSPDDADKSYLHQKWEEGRPVY